MSGNHLLVLVVNQHLVLGILFHVEHFLLLITDCIVALREGAVLLVRDLLLRLLLVILYLNLCCANLLTLVDLR